MSVSRLLSSAASDAASQQLLHIRASYSQQTSRICDCCYNFIRRQSLPSAIAGSFASESSISVGTADCSPPASVDWQPTTDAVRIMPVQLMMPAITSKPALFPAHHVEWSDDDHLLAWLAPRSPPTAMPEAWYRVSELRRAFAARLLAQLLSAGRDALCPGALPAICGALMRVEAAHVADDGAMVNIEAASQSSSQA